MSQIAAAVLLLIIGGLIVLAAYWVTMSRCRCPKCRPDLYPHETDPICTKPDDDSD